MIKYSLYEVSTMFSNRNGTMGRNCLPRPKTWRTVRQTRNQDATHAHKRVTIPLSKDDVDGSEIIIWKCNFAFLQSYFNHSKRVCIQRKKEKDKKAVGWGSQKDIYGERCPWKLEENKMYVCVFVAYGLRSTSFVPLELRRRARFPSVLQGHPWRTLPAFLKQLLEQM